MARKRVDYQRYLASREWALLREAVKQRASPTGDPDDAVCERCEQAPMQATHHLTYERIGQEDLKDLLGVCSGCHDFLSGKSAVDPLVAPVHQALREIVEAALAIERQWKAGHLYALTCSLEKAEYASRLARYRLARRAAAATALPLTIEGVRDHQPEVSACCELSAEEVANFSLADRVFARPARAGRRTT